MQFLRTLFWIALTTVLVLFAIANWFPVTIELWGGLAADVKLPVLVFGAFLIGFLPTFLLYRARLWSLRRRLETHERNASSNLVPPGAMTSGRNPSDEAPAPHSTISPAS